MNHALTAQRLARGMVAVRGLVLGSANDTNKRLLGTGAAGSAEPRQGWAV